MQKFRSLFFQVFQLQQRIVPAPFQCACHQTLGRIDFLIAPLGECGFILGTFEPHLPLAQDGLIARLQLLQGCQSDFHFGRLQCLQYFFHDGGVEQITAKAHAVLGRQAFATQPVALITRINATVAGVAYCQGAATVAAQ